MTSTIQPERGTVAPGPVLYFTEPARAAADFGLLALSAPLLAALPRARSAGAHPVLVLPGLGATDSSTAVLRAVLRHLGYRTSGWQLGRNIGPTARVVNDVPARLEALADRFEAPVSLIGWSLGGIYARQLARRRPDAVRQVITLGSPFRLAHRGQSRGDRMYRRYSDQHVEPEELPLESGAGPLPVPTTSIYSPLDGIVAWRTCLNEPAPRAENIAVAASHLGYGHHPAVIWAIADRLAQPIGKWTPFRPPPLLRSLYPQPKGTP